MEQFIIGLMSGTSLDGLDIAYVKFLPNDLSNFEIIHAETIPYSQKWYDLLKNAFKIKASEFAKLDADYGIFLGNQVNKFIQKHHISHVDLIASHGQTVFHRPEQGYTTQIGNGAHINAITKIKTICDFRTQDVALNGQGAPLVPIGDRLLFSQYDYCLNIGGFANISYEKDKKRIAYDICPTNIVLNHYTNKLGKAYDDGGKIAQSGHISNELLQELNQLTFYKDQQPKSLGWEFVVETIIPIIDKYQLNIPDILTTYVEHMAMQIMQKTRAGNMLVTGGGAFNNYLVNRMRALGNTEIIIPDKNIIDYKEALIFALLGYLKNINNINILSSVTGSKFDHSSGVIFDAYNH